MFVKAAGGKWVAVGRGEGHTFLSPTWGGGGGKISSETGGS